MCYLHSVCKVFEQDLVFIYLVYMKQITTLTSLIKPLACLLKAIKYYCYQILLLLLLLFILIIIAEGLMPYLLDQETSEEELFSTEPSYVPKKKTKDLGQELLRIKIRIFHVVQHSNTLAFL